MLYPDCSPWKLRDNKCLVLSHYMCSNLFHKQWRINAAVFSGLITLDEAHIYSEVILQ